MINQMQSEGNVTFPCMIAKAEIGRTNKNTPYLTLSLQDASGCLDARYWNLSEEESKAWKEGMVVEVSGELKRYRNAWQMRVFSMKSIEGEALDYVPSAPLSREELKAEVDALVAKIVNPVIHDLTCLLLERFETPYYTYPAAVRNHHNFPGGLAWHSLSMARIALAVLAQYTWLDYDLVIAGTLLHDLAKIEEYSAPVLPEYTASGNLIGHISMGAQMIDRAAVELGIDQSEEVMLLKHMVLSHHGRYEYGSPVLPMTAEAELLSLLDNLDSRLFMIDATLEQVAPGTFGPRNFALDNRMFYRKTWDDKDNRPCAPVTADSKEEAAVKAEDSAAAGKTDSSEAAKDKAKDDGVKKEQKPAGTEARASKPETCKESSPVRERNAREDRREKAASDRHSSNRPVRNERSGRNERKSEKSGYVDKDGSRTWSF